MAPIDGGWVDEEMIVAQHFEPFKHVVDLGFMADKSCQRLFLFSHFLHLLILGDVKGKGGRSPLRSARHQQVVVDDLDTIDGDAQTARV